ncbi:GNAT family N-acetyltransferase [Candidatus Microgenomates bacterium]|nr:GNAT family N-acetyltransferase [Candidatus Microgenomates bacterium]
MTVRIRKAELRDLQDILHLNYLLFQEDFKRDKTLNLKWTYSKIGRSYYKERITKHDGYALTAELNGEIVGYLVGGLQKRKFYRIRVQYAELENMFVLPEFRRRRIGDRLAQKFFSWCKTKKINYISVTASASNQLGIKFYKKIGFKAYHLTLEKKLK